MHLRNAPLVHVLAQVVFEPVLDIQAHIAAIQPLLREVGLLRLVEGITHQVTVVAGNPPDVTSKRKWDFLDRDRQTGIVLSDSSLVLHTTNYQSVDPFMALLRSGVSVLREQVGVQVVDRIGLRYIDLVRPDPSERFDEYVLPGVLGFPFDEANLGAVLTAMRTEAVASISSGGILVVRSTLLPPGEFVPPDLTTGSLAYRLPQSDRPALALDFDHFSEETFDFDPDEIIARMRRLHAVHRHAFEVVCTEHAFNRWGPWEKAECPQP